MTVLQNVEQFDQQLSIARQAFVSNLTKNVEFRRKQLKCLYKMLDENETQFVDSLTRDLKKPRFESMMTEIDFVLNDIRSALNNLSSWTSRKYVSKCFVTLVDDNYIQYEPYGVVLIVGAWNYPIQLTLSPLVGAIAAGNSVIIKPSEHAPATASLLSKLLPIYLNQQAYHCVLGDGQLSRKLVGSPRIDYVFFTGSISIGTEIYKTASVNLTPCTLELGGKSPVYIDELTYTSSTASCSSKSFDDTLFETSVKRILWGKLINTGQTCVAPDYVFCTPLIAEKFLQTAAKIINQFYGPQPRLHKDYGRIVDERHYRRLTEILSAQLIKQNNNQVIGGKFEVDENGNYFIEPTILCCSSFYDEPIMQAEIFGPILPLVVVKNEDEAISLINSRDKPLSLYIFSKRDKLINKFQDQTSSGSICVNDTVLHLVAEALPFGGVGKSGIGAYHGKYSFKTFSHKKSVLVRGFNPLIEWVASKRYPPYSENHLVRMLRLLKRRKNPIPLSARNQVNIFFFILGILFCYFYINFIQTNTSHFLQ